MPKVRNRATTLMTTIGEAIVRISYYMEEGKFSRTFLLLEVWNSTTQNGFNGLTTLRLVGFL